MKSRMALLALSLGLFLAPSSAPRVGAVPLNDDKVQAETARDRQRLTGTWEVFHWELGGGKRKMRGRCFFVFTKDRSWFFIKPDDLDDLDPDTGALYRLDVTKTPRRIIIGGKDFQIGDKDCRLFAIYKIEDDVLTLCWGDEHPAEFKTSREDKKNERLFKAKRCKPRK